MPGAPSADRWRWRMVLVGTLVQAVGFGLTTPFLVVYLHSVRHVSLPVAGLVVAVGGATGLAAATVGGSLGDRWGAGRLVVVALGLRAVGTLGLAGAHGAGTGALAVAFAAAGDAMAWPALNTLVTELVPADEAHRAYAVRFGVLNAGIGIGGLVAGSVVSLGRPVTFEVLFACDAAATAVFAGVLRLVLPARTAPAVRPAPDGRGGYRAVVSDGPFRAYVACTVLFVLSGYAQLEGGWAAYATAVVGVSPRVVGYGFAANTATIVVAQLGVARVTERWRRSRSLAVVGALWAGAWVVCGLADLRGLRGLPAEVALVASLAVFGVGETVLSPVLGAVPNELAPDHLRARYNSVGTSAFALGGMVGPPLAGLLLGDTPPLTWVGAIAVGAVLAGAAGLRLGRRLPAAVERPPVSPATPTTPTTPA